MNGALTRIETAAIAPTTPHGLSLTREQVELLKRTVAAGTTDDELALYLTTSQRMGLDPFARQIHAVKRWDARAQREVMAIQVGIDGLRLVAQRSGEYQGQVGPQWCGTDGRWYDVWLGAGTPAAARVGVLRAGFREPLYAVARWASYAQTKKGGELTAMWARLPDVMLAKCAEALALRKAFPAELSGAYAPEEMGDVVDVPTAPEPQALPSPREPAGAPPVVDVDALVRRRVAATQRLDSAVRILGRERAAGIAGRKPDATTPVADLVAWMEHAADALEAEVEADKRGTDPAHDADGDTPWEPAPVGGET